MVSPVSVDSCGGSLASLRGLPRFLLTISSSTTTGSFASKLSTSDGRASSTETITVNNNHVKFKDERSTVFLIETQLSVWMKTTNTIRNSFTCLGQFLLLQFVWLGSLFFQRPSSFSFEGNFIDDDWHFGRDQRLNFEWSDILCENNKVNNLHFTFLKIVQISVR